jgi:hypothetical protein
MNLNSEKKSFPVSVFLDSNRIRHTQLNLTNFTDLDTIIKA